VQQSIIWAGTKVYTPLALRVRWPHISPPGVRVKCGKSTAPAITLPDHSAVYTVECGRPQGGREGRSNAYKLNNNLQLYASAPPTENVHET